MIEDCTTKLAWHRAVREAGADPALVTAWIAETQVTQRAAQAQLHVPAAQPDALTRDQIAALVHHHADLARTLAAATPTDRAEVYKSLGLRLTFDP